MKVPSNIWELLFNIFWKNLISKIVLFVIVSCVGLFSLWSSLTDDQKNNVWNISSSEIEGDYKYDLVTVLERNDYLDLCLWKEVPFELRGEKVSPVVRTSVSTVVKKTTTESFRREFLMSSGLRPDITCISHPYTITERPEDVTFDGMRRIRLTIDIDISNERVDDEFDIVLQVMTWNSYQDRQKRAGALIKHETLLLNLSVFDPMGIAQCNYFYFDIGTRVKKELEPGYFSFGEDNTTVHLRIEKPRIGHTYVLDWGRIFGTL